MSRPEIRAQLQPERKRMTMSMRLRAHQLAKAGETAAAAGLRAALARNTRGNPKSPALPSRAAAPVRQVATTTPQVSTPKGPSAWTQRLQTVAKAVETDARCKGKASIALGILADKSLDGLSAAAVIKAVGMAGAPTDAAAEARSAVMLGLIAEGTPFSAAAAAARNVAALPTGPAKAASPAQPARAMAKPAAAVAPKAAAPKVDASAGWKRAAAAVNAARGLADAPSPEGYAGATGWKKATAAANASRGL